jgi:hypothetical protein
MAGQLQYQQTYDPNSFQVSQPSWWDLGRKAINAAIEWALPVPGEYGETSGVPGGGISPGGVPQTQPPAMNWTPWLLGGGILLVGLFAFTKR